jgi:hypothetical protein
MGKSLDGEKRNGGDVVIKNGKNKHLIESTLGSASGRSKKVTV